MSTRKVQTAVKATKAEEIEVPEKAPKAEKAPKEEVTKKTTKSEEPKEPVAAAAVEAPEEVVESQEEETIESQMVKMMVSAANAQKHITSILQDMKKLHKNYLAEKKKNQKILSKSTATKKQRSGSNGLDKLVPIKTTEFRTFIEKNYQQLNDKDGNQILGTLNYDDSDGSLLLSRKSALQIVTAYVKHHNLQQYEDKKRIKMDATLKKLFPDNAERKEKDGSVVEENFYFYSIMGALSRHFNKEEEA